MLAKDSHARCFGAPVMQPTVNFIIVLNFLGAVQALLLAFVLVSAKRGNRTANLMLAAFMANASILLAWTVLNSTSYVYLFPHLLRFNHPFDFAIAPLLYLYVKVLTARSPRLKKRDLLHFIPSVLCVIYLLPFYFQSGEAKLNSLNSPEFMRWYYVRSSLVISLAVVYVTLAGLHVVRYLRRVKERTSAAERAALSQVKFLVISFSTLWVVALFRYLIDLSNPAYSQYTGLALPFGGTLIIYGMAYLSLRKPETLSGLDHPAPSEEAGGLLPARKYEKSTLTSERSDVYLKKLLAVMDTEKPYMDGDLTLARLATKLSVSAHHLSQIINERLNQNFFDFVNTYRVEEAKRMLVNPAKKHYSLLAIAEEVGFNSKSAFNTAFKKQTNMTPSEFRKASNGQP
jgi:AraC-like DNA-binding protein